MVSATPEISVVLPVRDGAATLAESLDSLLAQSFEDFEIVVVDDGSRDGTDRIVREFADQDGRVRSIRLERSGIVAALNAGVASACGTFVARHDADDLACAERLERQRAWFDRHASTTVVSCRVETFPRDESRRGMLLYEEWINGLESHDAIVREMFVESPIPHPTAMMRRADLVAIGGYRDLGWPEDYDLWLRLYERGARFAKVPETLLRWRDAPERLSRRSPTYRRDAFLRAKAHFLPRTWLAEATDDVRIWGAGPVGRRMARFLESEGVVIRAFIDIDPAKIGRVRRGAPVVSPDSLRTARASRTSRVLVAVAARGAREKIRAELVELGYVETVDFLCVA